MLNSIFSQTAQGGVNVTLTSLLICFGVAILLGILTSFTFSYKIKHSQSFALTLALLPMAVCIVIVLVNGKIGTGIAVAGAFTLVRFRSIPGTAREISAIFTAMVIGLALGIGYIGIAVIFFAFTAVLTIVLTTLDFGGSNTMQKDLKITIPENIDYNGLFDDLFEEYKLKTSLIQVRTINMGTLFELTYNVRFPEKEIPKSLLDGIRSRNGNLGVVVCNEADVETL